jgi:hypothetical protein
MTDLLRFALDVHGSLDRCRAASEIKAHVSIGGTMWLAKTTMGCLTILRSFSTRTASGSLITPFIIPGQRSVFEPDRNVIETLDGEMIEERLNPRAAFASHTAETL